MDAAERTADTASDVAAEQDFFEDVLNLEDQYYTEGYTLGFSDGSRAGRIEGRTFGLEKGFDKFQEMGRMNGRVSVWQSRLPTATSRVDPRAPGEAPLLSNSDRLRKHIDRLGALTEAGTMPTENSEQAVADFDDRLRDAKSKMKLIAKMVGEEENVSSSEPKSAESGRGPSKTGEMEDFRGLPNTRKDD